MWSDTESTVLLHLLHEGFRDVVGVVGRLLGIVDVNVRPSKIANKEFTLSTFVGDLSLVAVSLRVQSVSRRWTEESSNVLIHATGFPVPVPQAPGQVSSIAHQVFCLFIAHVVVVEQVAHHLDKL